jgi:enoyl-CoA hydratase
VTAAAEQSVLVELDGHVATVTINRPAVLNALDREAFESLDAAFDRFATDEAIRVVVVTGAGDRAFSAGADIRALHGLGDAGALDFMEFGQRVFDALAHSPKPTIAAINGYALGGGLELAMACDVRIAADSARLGQPEITLGSIPGWGGTQRLPLLVGLGRARELILTGRLIDAAEAERIGLVNRIVPRGEILAAAREMADRMASLPPIALALAKDAIRVREGDIAAGLVREREHVAATFATEDQREGTRAFFEKRSPEFKGR